VESSPRPSGRNPGTAGAERPEQRLELVFVDEAAIVGVEHRERRGDVLLIMSTQERCRRQWFQVHAACTDIQSQNNTAIDTLLVEHATRRTADTRP
jgi:hypothetical protein